MESADYSPSYVQASACHTSDGKLWFATTKGVTVIDPLRLPVNRLPPPVLLESALADDQDLPLREGARVGPGEEIQFHYTALSFVSPEKVRFRYMLKGFDRDWTAARAPHRLLQEPPAHRYRFRVRPKRRRGLDESGVASRSSSSRDSTRPVGSGC